MDVTFVKFEIFCKKYLDGEIEINPKWLRDKNIALKMIDVNMGIYKRLDETLQHDKDIICKLFEFKCFMDLIHVVSKKYFDDYDLMKKMIWYHMDSYQYIDDSLKNNRKFAIECIKADSLVLKHFTPEFKKDREMVELAIIKNPYSIQYADISLQMDFDLLCLAFKDEREVDHRTKLMESLHLEVRHNGNLMIKLSGIFVIWRTIDNRLLDDREFVLDFMNNSNSLIYSRLPDYLRKDEEIAIKYLNNGGTFDGLHLVLWDNLKILYMCIYNYQNHGYDGYVSRKLRETFEYLKTREAQLAWLEPKISEAKMEILETNYDVRIITKDMV